MAKYRATVQVTGISGENPRAVRAALDAQLRKSGFENCRVVQVDLEGAPPPPVTRPNGLPPPGSGEVAWRRQTNIGGLLLVAAAAWAIWFFWWMLSGTPE